MSPALILDCDGVLADTELDGHLVAFNKVFADAGVGFQWGVEEYGQLLKIGGGKERLRHYLSQHPEHDLGQGEELDARIAQFHKAKSAAYVEIVEAGKLPGRPGVRRLIEEALDSGWQVAVASTSAVGSVEAVLASVIGEENRARMAGVFAGDMVKAKKPAPDIYLMALEALGVNEDQAVVIEDSEAGAKAAENANLTHIVTVSHYTTEDPFPAAATVVNYLGESDDPAVTLAGPDLTHDGVISLASLEDALKTRQS
ncbi:HAD-IA family hydrolase [Propionibacteriaceae bacterium Y1923]|uniref:HAD-IA family hydrolase n=1 Tax=Aestuariimicrobium sp. Y1814 TaxID=3418742 RepID=UPI003C281349